MSTYKSQGTVSFCTGEKGTWINFVPHGDYLVKHKGKSYAVFLTDNGGECFLKPCKDEHGNPIKIEIRLEMGNIGQTLKCSDLKVSEMLIWAAAQSAAITHSKVQLEVDTTAGLKLIGITVPDQ